MLKLGAVRWRGKCSRHPKFDPATDGPGAIRGGCTRCTTLHEIYLCHQRMMTLMRGFAPPQPRKKITPADRDRELQASLF
jgi:hypothetical protein